MAGILDALKIIKEQLPKFTQEMGVPFLGKDKPSSVTDKVDPNLEKKALETLLPMLVMGAGIAPAAMRATNLAFKYPKIAGAGIAAATGDPSAAIVNPVLSLALGSNDAEAAYVTPRAGATTLKKFQDAVLEHIRNPEVKLPTSGSIGLRELYGQTAEGRDIIKATSLPNIPVILDEAMDPRVSGKFIRDELTGTPKEIRLNAFPTTAEYTPQKTLYHEVQHVIDLVQGRAFGTSLRESKQVKGAVQAEDVLKHTSKEGTIDKKTLGDIMDQSEGLIYAREVGENRARMDAGQFPQFEPYATWMQDPVTKAIITGR